MNIKMLLKSAVKGAIEHVDVICAIASCACTIMATVEGVKAGMVGGDPVYDTTNP